MDIETWFQIHTNVSNFEMASPQNHTNAQKVAHFCYPCKIMLYSYHFDKTELKITIFINFQVYHRNEKNFESSYGFGGHHLKIRDVCMDLGPCFKVQNLVVIQLKTPNLAN